MLIFETNLNHLYNRQINQINNMSVQLKTLLEATPFENQTKNQLLDKLDSLTPDQQFRLSSACWTALSAKFQAKLKAEINLALLEVMEGKKKYTKEDFLNIENSLYAEFAKLLQSAQTEEEVGQVREELQKYMTMPPTKPVQSNSVPQSNPQPPTNPQTQTGSSNH